MIETDLEEVQHSVLELVDFCDQQLATGVTEIPGTAFLDVLKTPKFCVVSLMYMASKIALSPVLLAVSPILVDTDMPEGPGKQAARLVTLAMEDDLTELFNHCVGIVNAADSYSDSEQSAEHLIQLWANLIQLHRAVELAESVILKTVRSFGFVLQEEK